MVGKGWSLFLFLIGFWFKKDSANAAAIKAFIVNRVGDFGFALGIFLIFYVFGTVNYDEVFSQIPQSINKEISFLGMDFESCRFDLYTFVYWRNG